MLPEFDFQEKKWTGFILRNAPKFGMVGQASNISCICMLNQLHELFGILSQSLYHSSFLQS